MLKPPEECYKEFGSDLDGCSRQENEGCNGCRCLIETDTERAVGLKNIVMPIEVAGGGQNEE